MNPNAAHDILRKAERIAIMRTDRLGDMVLTLPLARALKEQFPHASVEMIARSYAAPLIENIPVVNKVHYTDTQALRDILRYNSFDALFFPRMRVGECYEALRAAVPLRVGSGYRWYSWMLNLRIKQHRKHAERHEAEYNVAMLEAISGTSLPVQLVKPYVPDAARQEIAALLQSLGIGAGEKFMVIHPGSGGSAREWAAERFGQAAHLIAQERGLRVVISGVANEAEKCSLVLQECPGAVNLCGSVHLRHMIALLEQAQLLVANSTGVLHIAAALGTPVVGLYPNSPALSARRWGPYSLHSRVISPPFHPDPTIADDMQGIALNDVVEQALALV